MVDHKEAILSVMMHDYRISGHIPCRRIVIDCVIESRLGRRSGTLTNMRNNSRDEHPIGRHVYRL